FVTSRFMGTGLLPAEIILSWLNSSGPTGDRVRAWAGRWLTAERNLAKCPSLISELNRELQHYERRIVPCGVNEMDLPTLTDFYLPRNSETDDWPEYTGEQPIKVHFSTKGEMPLVAAHFVDFLRSSEATDLVVCGRPACGRFFLRTPKRTKYHSDDCA